jgi:pilus assembly protein FimV
MNKMLRLPIALAFALGASNALALGLGQVQVKSSLNQPLLAEIPVLENAPGEAADLQVRLASAESFARIGLDRPSGSLLSALKFEIAKDAAGKPVIRITTPNRVNDPFLSLLIEAEWARGKLLREYTLLLDPPIAVPSRAQPSQISALPQGDVQPAPAQELASPPPMATPRAAAASAPSFAPGESYGPVSEGDSLWKIATRSIPDSSVNINQMMIALLRANPDAFIGGNINRLRTGAVLRIPSREEIGAIGATEAAQQVREQTDSATSLQPVESAGSRRTAAEPAPARTDSRLAIVPPSGDTPATAAQSGAAADGRGAELRADLARAREQGEAVTQENRELRTRVQELEKIRGDSERLLTLRNSELQALQQRLAELEAQRVASASATPDPTASAAAETPLPAALETPIAAVDAQPETDNGMSEGAESASGFEAETPNLDGAAAEASAEPVASAAPVVPASEPAEPVTPSAAQATPPSAPVPARAAEPWYQNPLVLGGGGAILLGLLALLGLRGRGRKKAAAAAAGGATGSRFDSSDFGVPAAGSAFESEAAETYDDAEERDLLDHLAEQPDDLERHLDLVRYYYSLNDASRFEGAVEAMYAQVFDPHESTWQQALQMGREMLPDHPLFMEQSNERQPWEAVDDTADAGSGYAGSSYDDLSNSPAASAASISDEPEFRVDLSAPELEVPEMDREQRLPDFELDSPRTQEPAASADEPASSSEDTSADLGISLDSIEAAATKLELARAYLDMGDVEGARGMLEEVALEGTSEQRTDAKRLLDEIR